MSSGPDNRPLTRLFRPGGAPPSPALAERIAALDGASPQQLAALAVAENEETVRAAAIERLPDGEHLRELAGLSRRSAPSAPCEALAQQRLATLIDAQKVSWASVCSDSESSSALLQVAERCSDPAVLEQAVGSIPDPRQIVQLVLEGGSLRVRQAAARRIGDHEDVHRLLKQLQGKDKSVYRILKDKRDAWRADVHKAEHVEQDIRTIYTSLEALYSKPYDALFAPALEHFEARWQTFEGRAQPWARDRVRAAIDRCRAILDAHLKEATQHAAKLAEQSAREAAQHLARAEAEARAAEAARERDLAAAQAAAQAEELRQAEEKERVEREAAHANALRQIAALMSRAHGALRAGHTGPAAGLRRAIEEKLSEDLALPPSLARGLQELDAKLQSMKDWKDYAAAPKRAELIAEMEALPGSKESPQKLAERIKELRAQWKTISQGVLVDSEADWQRFNQAATVAYEPCREYFEAQARLRAENVEKRRHVLERVQAFELRQSGENPDWHAIGTVLYEAPLEWRRIGPVERAAIRPLEQEFDASLGRLRARREEWQSQNAIKKKTLIERAQALLEVADIRAAVDGAKGLQRQWREVGPAQRELEGALWQEFRSHCDGVFKKQENAAAEYTASLESRKIQALALCEQAEQVSHQQGIELLESAKLAPQWRSAFEALGELPRSEARALRSRFERALSQCETQVSKQRARDAAQLFDHLIEASRRIGAYGWAVAQGLAESEREGLKSAAESFIAGIPQWPKGGATVLKSAWAHAEGAGKEKAENNESALRMLCIRAELSTNRPSPEADQSLRRNYQLQRLVQVMGKREEASSNDWESLALEWAGVGPVSVQVYEELLARFRQCRRA
jgi:Domain of Unknown Function (DUF349)